MADRSRESLYQYPSPATATAAARYQHISNHNHSKPTNSIPPASPHDTLRGENGSDDDSDATGIGARFHSSGKKIKRRATTTAGSREHSIVREVVGNLRRLSGGTVRSSDREPIFWENGGTPEEISAATLRKERRHRERAERERERERERMEREREAKNKEEREKERAREERREEKRQRKQLSKMEKERAKSERKRESSGASIMAPDDNPHGGIKLHESPPGSHRSSRPASMEIPAAPSPSAYTDAKRREVSVSPLQRLAPVVPPSPPQSAKSERQQTTPPPAYVRRESDSASTPPQSPPDIMKPSITHNIPSPVTAPRAPTPFSDPAIASSKSFVAPKPGRKSIPASPVEEKKKKPGPAEPAVVKPHAQPQPILHAVQQLHQAQQSQGPFLYRSQTTSPSIASSSIVTVRRSPSAAAVPTLTAPVAEPKRQSTPPRISDPTPRISDPAPSPPSPPSARIASVPPQIPRISDPPPRPPSPSASEVTTAPPNPPDLSKRSRPASPAVSKTVGLTESPLIQAQPNKPQRTASPLRSYIAPHSAAADYAPHSAGAYFPPQPSFSPTTRPRAKRPMSFSQVPTAYIEDDVRPPRGKHHGRSASANPYPPPVPPYFREHGYGYAPPLPPLPPPPPSAYPAYGPYDMYSAYRSYSLTGPSHALDRPDPFIYMTTSEAAPTSERSGRHRESKSAGGLNREYYDDVGEDKMEKVRGDEAATEESEGVFTDGSASGWTTRSGSPADVERGVGDEVEAEVAREKEMEKERERDEEREKAEILRVKQRVEQRQLQMQKEWMAKKEAEPEPEKGPKVQHTEPVKIEPEVNQAEINQLEEKNPEKVTPEIAPTPVEIVVPGPIPVERSYARVSEPIATSSEPEVAESSDERPVVEGVPLVEERLAVEAIPPAEQQPSLPVQGRPSSPAPAVAPISIPIEDPSPLEAGYPLLAKTRATAPGRQVYRRFTALNHRILLHMQDEISEMSSMLEKLDAEPEANLRNRRRMVATPCGEQRLQLLGAIAWKLGQYNEAVKAYQNILTIPPAEEEDVAEFRDWLKERHPVTGKEAHYLDDDTDLMALGRLPKPATPAPVIVHVPTPPAPTPAPPMTAATPPKADPPPPAEVKTAPPQTLLRRISQNTALMQIITILAILIAPLLYPSPAPAVITAPAAACAAAAAAETVKMSWAGWFLRAMIWILALAAPAAVGLMDTGGQGAKGKKGIGKDGKRRKAVCACLLVGLGAGLGVISL